MTEVSDMITKRMRKIGSKKNFNIESQAQELNENQETVKVIRKSEGGVDIIDLVLEPNKFNELGSETRLSFDEFIDAINGFIEEEEDDWGSLRMKDQINMTKDRIIADTIVKYAEENLDINTERISGREISYIKRFGANKEYLGEAVIVSLTRMPQLGIVLN